MGSRTASVDGRGQEQNPARPRAGAAWLENGTDQEGGLVGPSDCLPAGWQQGQGL